jgi:cell division protein FtsZ
MFGMSMDETMGGRLRVSVVATGIDTTAQQVMPNLKVVNGGEPVNFPSAVSNQSVNQQGSAAVSRPGGYVPEPPATPLISKAFVDRGSEIALGAVEAPAAPAAPAVVNAVAATADLMSQLTQPAPAASATQAAPVPAAAPRPAARPSQPAHAVAPTPVRVPETPKSGGSIFKSVFGFGGAAKQAAPAHPQQRQEPAIHAEPQESRPEPRQESRPAVRPAQIDEVGLEIPAFLRRGP